MTRDEDRDRGPGERGEATGDSPAEDLVALLYGELDGDEASRVRAQLTSDPEAAGHMADLERVREMFRELPEEEPPARLSAQLLAEAARAAGADRRVPAAAEDGGGFMARLVAWLQPLVQRPGLAAAASLVLVAGVAGVLYVRKGEELARPSARPDVAAERAAGGEPMSDEAPAAEPTTTVTGPAEEADAPADSLAEGAAEDSNDAARGGAADLRARRAEKRETPATKKPAPERKAKERAAQSSREYARPPSEPAPETKATDKGAMAPGAVHGLSEQEFAPPPPPPAQRAPSGSTGSAGSAAGSGSAPAPAPDADAPKAPVKDAPLQKASPSARDLHTRALDAALDRRCADVRALERRVRELDARYHRDVFATDSRLRACLGSSSSGSKTSDQPAKK